MSFRLLCVLKQYENQVVLNEKTNRQHRVKFIASFGLLTKILSDFQVGFVLMKLIANFTQRNLTQSRWAQLKRTNE